MGIQSNIGAIEERIQFLKKAAEDLKVLGEDMPAVYRNTARILASLKMLEINISDVVELRKEADPLGPETKR